MNTLNGYTSNEKVLALKAELRKNKIRFDRLVKITLDYAKKCNIAKGQLPKQIEYILEVTEYLSKRNKELGILIQRERQFVSDSNKSNHKKSNDTASLTALDRIVNSFQAYTETESFTKIKNDDESLSLHFAWNNLIIKLVKSDIDVPKNAVFVADDDIDYNSFKMITSIINNLGFNKLADFILPEEQMDCAVQITEDGKYFVVCEAMDDKNSDEIYNYIMYINF